MATKKHMNYDSDEAMTLRGSKIPKAIMASEGTRFDSAEDASVFFARELDHVKAQSYDVEYPELTALHLFPQSSEADPGAETITYYTYDKTGLAKIIDNYSTDLPRADVTGKPSFAKIKSIGDSYGYSAQEMRASRLAGKSLDARKGESARYQIDALTNKIAWCGDEESGLMGVLSDGQNIPLYTIGANASGKTKWAEKSADEILADVNGMAKQVAKITKNVERPDTLCVPADVFMDISTRRIPDTSTTVLAFIQEHAPYIKNVVSTAELDADSPETNPYSDISEVEDAGFVTSGADADPVGLAASVAFAQSPRPTAVYIAIQQLSEGAVVAGQTIKDTNAAVVQYAGKKEGLTGCAISFKESSRKLSMVLDGPITGVKNTGLFDMLAALIADGYTATIEDTVITDGASFKACPVWNSLKKLDKGGEEQFTVAVNKTGGTAVLYTVAVSYPDPDAPATQAAEDNEPANTPDSELETPATTIALALATSGWYVLCTAGVDPAKYEEIAAYMETQEKLFCYTELDCFPTPGTVREDDEDLVQPSVGNVYFRTLGVYGRETTDQADEDIPPANRYINVAFVAKWLNYESGSETTAFKQLASVYPSKLTSTEMKALADKSLNYFITVGSKNLSMNGKVIGNEWADIIRFRDWLKNDMQLRVVNLFVTRPKVPYTDAGISLVQNQMIASLKSGQDAGGIAESEFDEDGTEIPGYVTSVPLAASLSASEKASRKLTKCKFKARLAGAIHFAELKGSLTYEL